MWRAKGSDGFEQHIDRLFANAEFFTAALKAHPSFEMVLEQPECTNVSFWYVPPSLQAIDRHSAEFTEKIHKVAPKIKERMMREGSLMMTYQPLRNHPNFFRLVMQNSTLDQKDMQHILDEIVRLGSDL